MRPRWPLPMGAIRSMIRAVMLVRSPGTSSRSRSSGNNGVRSSKRGRWRATSGSTPLTASMRSMAGFFSLRPAGRAAPVTLVALAQRELADLLDRDVDVVLARQVARPGAGSRSPRRAGRAAPRPRPAHPGTAARRRGGPPGGRAVVAVAAPATTAAVAGLAVAAGRRLAIRRWRWSRRTVGRRRRGSPRSSLAVRRSLRPGRLRASVGRAWRRRRDRRLARAAASARSVPRLAVVVIRRRSDRRRRSPASALARRLTRGASAAVSAGGAGRPRSSIAAASGARRRGAGRRQRRARPPRPGSGSGRRSRPCGPATTACRRAPWRSCAARRGPCARAPSVRVAVCPRSRRPRF